MSGTAAKLGRILADSLGIQVEDSDLEIDEDGITRPRASDSFIEGPPTTAEWLHNQVPTRDEMASYANSLLPCLSWVGRYNLQWLASDMLAGITIGAVVVPQGMAYAMLAKVPPEYGLYSSFVGVMIYWVFGTSKDISIGPVAVLSTLVGNVVHAVQDSEPDIEAHVIASALSVVSGTLVLAMGLFRWGWIVDLISITCLSAFMTASAVTIAASQLPALLGLSGFSNRDAPYKVIINTFNHITEASADAVVGLSALFVLYLIRSVLTRAASAHPRRKRLIFFMNTMRSVVVIIVYTIISFVMNKDRRGRPVFDVLGTVPQGFREFGIPKIDTKLAQLFGSYLPATIIVMLVEHIAIAKSFGRVNNYTIDPSQEMVAIGVTNILGPFLGGYPSTGSFSRTAIKSKAGVRTPAAGIFTGLVVLMATYLLTSVFFYIPSATLAAVIVHAVGDLITPPNTIYQFWRVSPLEFFVFFIGVIVSIFWHIEDGLYATVTISAAILVYRILKARGTFLGRVKVHSVLGDHVIGDDHRQVIGEYGTFHDEAANSARNVFLPLDHGDGSNPNVTIMNPYPGIFIYRFSEGFNYPNANASLEYLTEFVYANTTRTSPEVFEQPGDRPWNSAGPRRSSKARGDQAAADQLPTLKAIILDFSSVNNVDITSVQRLIDVRNQLDLYAAPEVVDWHIACISNRWAKRALVAGGFGVPTKPSDGLHHRWKSIFSIAEIGGENSAAAAAEEDANELALKTHYSRDEESDIPVESDALLAAEPVPDRLASGSERHGPGAGRKTRRKGAPLNSLSRPLFHVDLTSAVQGAIANVEAKQELRDTLQVQGSNHLGIL